MDDAEADVLAYMGFPAPHRAQLCSTYPLERLNKEIKRRSDVVGMRTSVRRIHFAIASDCPNKVEFELAYLYLQRAFSSA